MASYRIGQWSAGLALIVGLQTPAFAQDTQGTEAQRQACTPDAFRLCMNAMPDPDRVEACLRASGRRLSQPCYDVFFPQQQIAQPQSPQTGPRQRPNGPMLPPPSQQDDDDN